MTWSLWKINFAKTGGPGQFSSKLGGHPGFGGSRCCCNSTWVVKKLSCCILTQPLTSSDLLLVMCFINALSGGLLSPSLSPIRAGWNLTRPLTSSDLLLDMFFWLAPCGGSLSPSLSPIGAGWNLTRPLTFDLGNGLSSGHCFSWPSLVPVSHS